MDTEEITAQIQKLPVQKQIYVIERSMRLLRLQEEENQMRQAADALYEDYLTDKALTAFTDIDFESFYESK